MNFAHIHRPRKSKSAAEDESRLLGCRRPPLAASVGRLLRDFLNDFSSSAASQIGRETDVPSLPFSLSFLHPIPFEGGPINDSPPYPPQKEAQREEEI